MRLAKVQFALNKAQYGEKPTVWEVNRWQFRWWHREMGGLDRERCRFWHAPPEVTLAISIGIQFDRNHDYPLAGSPGSENPDGMFSIGIEAAKIRNFARQFEFRLPTSNLIRLQCVCGVLCLKPIFV